MIVVHLQNQFFDFVSFFDYFLYRGIDLYCLLQTNWSNHNVDYVSASLPVLAQDLFFIACIFSLSFLSGDSFCHLFLLIQFPTISAWDLLFVVCCFFPCRFWLCIHVYSLYLLCCVCHEICLALISTCFSVVWQWIYVYFVIDFYCYPDKLFSCIQFT